VSRHESCRLLQTIEFAADGGDVLLWQPGSKARVRRESRHLVDDSIVRRKLRTRKKARRGGPVATMGTARVSAPERRRDEGSETTRTASTVRAQRIGKRRCARRCRSAGGGDWRTLFRKINKVLEG
jgi:hypothetical protein